MNGGLSVRKVWRYLESQPHLVNLLIAVAVSGWQAL